MLNKQRRLSTSGTIFPHHTFAGARPPRNGRIGRRGARLTPTLADSRLTQGLTKSALPDNLGISRDTIHRWIRCGDLD